MFPFPSLFPLPPAKNGYSRLLSMVWGYGKRGRAEIHLLGFQKQCMHALHLFHHLARYINSEIFHCTEPCLAWHASCHVLSANIMVVGFYFFLRRLLIFSSSPFCCHNGILKLNHWKFFLQQATVMYYRCHLTAPMFLLRLCST